MKPFFAKHWPIFLAAGLSFFLFSATVAFLLPYENQNKTQVQPLGFSGSYTLAPSSTPKAIANGLASTADNPDILLEGSFDRPLQQNERIYFYNKNLAVRFLLDGQEVYAYGTPGSHPPFIRSAGTAWCSFSLPRSVTPESQWTIQMHNPYPNNYYNAYQSVLNSLQTGDSGALARQIFTQNWPFVLGSLTFLLLSLVLQVLVLVLRRWLASLHGSVYWLIGYALFTSLWILLNPLYSTLLFGNSALLQYLETLCLMAGAICLTAYFGAFFQPRTRRLNNLLFMALAGLLMLFLALQLLGLTDGYTFRTTIVFSMGITAAFVVAETLYNNRHTNQPTPRFLHRTALVFGVFVVLELINYELEWANTGNILFVGLLLFIMVQFVQATRYLHSTLQAAQRVAEMEKELVQSRMSIMLSQIHPHFLYNTLSGIKQLCDTQPKKASEALEHFSYYLRGNLDSLSHSQLVPFGKEREHVEDYLFLEQMRFAERVQVQWELEYTAFSLPALSLQPLVENAVRHGITKKPEGGLVAIACRRVGSEIVLTVHDNGVGFRPGVPLEDGKTHIGLANVRGRLVSLCGGSLHIESTPGQGTLATIKIPFVEGSK